MGIFGSQVGVSSTINAELIICLSEALTCSFKATKPFGSLSLGATIAGLEMSSDGVITTLAVNSPIEPNNKGPANNKG